MSNPLERWLKPNVSLFFVDDILYGFFKDSVFNFVSAQGCPGEEENTQARKAGLQHAHPSASLLKYLQSTIHWL